MASMYDSILYQCRPFNTLDTGCLMALTYDIKQSRNKYAHLKNSMQSNPFKID